MENSVPISLKVDTIEELESQQLKLYLLYQDKPQRLGFISKQKVIE